MFGYSVFILLIWFTYCQCEYSYKDQFDEELVLKPLPSGHVYAFFQFSVTVNRGVEDKSTFKHFRLFPRSLGEIISKHSVQELHLSLTQGLWRYEKWGYPVRDSSPGAELWAWFRKNTSDVDMMWKNLVNALSGQFCASLNFVDETNTVIPTLSFRPMGAVPRDTDYNSSYLRHSSLPRETVCTENLTPFKKLLPCNTKAGLSVLLNAIYVLNSHFFSIAVDFRTICKNENCKSTSIELKQSVSIVFDPPVNQLGKQDWSFVKLFGVGLTSTCPLASHSKAYVDVTSNMTGIPFVLTPSTYEIITKEDSSSGSLTTYAAFDLTKALSTSRMVNVAASYNKTHIYWYIPNPVVHANRYISGFGQERGGICCSIYNSHPSDSIRIIYMEVIPWFLRLYSHTLSITNNGKKILPEYQHYRPAKDRKRPHHMELVITLLPHSVTEISIEFEYAFLKWTEYPPDANHGFYVGSSVISALVKSNKNFTEIPSQALEQRIEQGYFLRFHTQVLLVSLPTPDFSMPYNVICLVCTVVALAFGPIHNVTTKRLRPIVGDVKGGDWFTKLKKFFLKWKRKPNKEESEIQEFSEELESKKYQ